jgi:hypothetical protein
MLEIRRKEEMFQTTVRCEIPPTATAKPAGPAPMIHSGRSSYSQSRSGGPEARLILTAEVMI